MTGAEATAVKTIEAFAKWSIGWLWRWMRPDTSRTALMRYADDLAATVAAREEMLFAQLGGGPDMVIGDLQFRAERRLKLASGDEVGVLKDVGIYFRRQQTRRLLVLGEPGAGKTVTVVHLVLDELEHRKTLTDAVRADEPVPVRVNATGWDASTDFTTWMARQLAIDYGLNPRVARALVDAGRILPVLDGLDEMDPPEAKPVLGRAALDRLNKLPWRNRAVVVTCRSTVYTSIRALRDESGLLFATAVTLQPLSAADIYFYLEKYRDEFERAEAEWAPVIDQLDRRDGVLATALRTPWLLSLAAMALKRGRHEKAVELAACRDTAEVSQRLFESLIPAAVEAIPEADSTPTYSEEEVQRWLHTLAQYLERRRSEHSGATQISLDQIWQLAGTRTCVFLHAFVGAPIVALIVAAVLFGATRAGVALIVAAVSALEIWAGQPTWATWLRGGVPIGFMQHQLSSAIPLVSAVTGLVFVLAVGIELFRATVGQHRVTTAKRFAWRVPGRSRWRRGLVRGLTVELLFGLPLAFLWRTDLIPWNWLPLSIMVALGFGLASGLVSGLGTTSEERLVLGQDAGRVIRNDVASALVVGIVCLVVGLTIGPLSDLAARPSIFLKGWLIWLPEGLLVGLAFGLTLAVFSAALSAVASGRYAIASLLFGFNGRFPRRPARFLEWARNIGLLRVTGVAYQFRHDTYQQWLTEGGGNRDVTVRPDPPADARFGLSNYETGGD